MSETTGHHDMHGIPIHVGDLIRVKHYRHHRNRRQMWLYFRVAVHPLNEPGSSGDVRYVVQNWDCLDSSRWQCLLKDCGIDVAEVLQESGLERDEWGELITFNERKRRVR